MLCLKFYWSLVLLLYFPSTSCRWDRLYIEGYVSGFVFQSHLWKFCLIIEVCQFFISRSPCWSHLHRILRISTEPGFYTTPPHPNILQFQLSLLVLSSSIPPAHLIPPAPIPTHSKFTCKIYSISTSQGHPYVPLRALLVT